MIANVLALAVTATLIVILLWRRPIWRRPRGEILVLEAWLETFSSDSYLPMLRLAASGDPKFLRTRRGPDEAARYARLQRQYLKAYLRGLSRDLHRLHTLVETRPAFARTLQGNSSLSPVEDKMEFIFSVWSLELRLLLSNFAPCAVNPGPLLTNVGRLTARAREIAHSRHELQAS